MDFWLAIRLLAGHMPNLEPANSLGSKASGGPAMVSVQSPDTEAVQGGARRRGGRVGEGVVAEETSGGQAVDGVCAGLCR